MLKGDSAYLFSALAQYGYSLLHPDQMADPNELLAKLSQSDNPRLLEGFPVVLANALGEHRDKLDLAAAEKSLSDEAAQKRFRKLLSLSFYLFGVFGLDDLKSAHAKHVDVGSRSLDELRDSVERNKRLDLGKTKLDLERVKNTFLRYFMQERAERAAENKVRLREEFRREYLLSLFFAPKQRDLLQKKLRGDKLNKTEREYFSRVVKKKLSALADPDLHRLAQKALQ